MVLALETIPFLPILAMPKTKCLIWWAHGIVSDFTWLCGWTQITMDMIMYATNYTEWHNANRKLGQNLRGRLVYTENEVVCQRKGKWVWLYSRLHKQLFRGHYKFWSVNISEFCGFLKLSANLWQMILTLVFWRCVLCWNHCFCWSSSGSK